MFLPRVKGLLAANERVILSGSYWLEEYIDPLYFAYVAVGALNVGSIEISGKAGYFEHNMHTPYEYSAGEEVGQFHFGSTIVLVYEVPVTHKVIYLAEEQKSIRVGDEFVLITKQQG